MPDEERPQGRRRRRERLGSLRAAEGEPRGSVDPEDDDDEDLNDEVEDRARSRTPLSELDTDGENATPSSRMADVRRRASNYEREYRLKLLHRMLMRNVPLDQIAQSLEVSVRTVQRDRQELFARIKEAARRFDLNHYIGDQMAFYNEARALALRAASNTRIPMNHRLAAIRTAVGASGDMTRMLNTTGVLDVVRFRPERGKGNEELRQLTDMARKLLGDEDQPSIKGEIPESELFDEAVLDKEEEVVLL